MVGWFSSIGVGDSVCGGCGVGCGGLQGGMVVVLVCMFCVTWDGWLLG